MNKPKAPKYLIRNGRKYTASGVAYTSRKYAHTRSRSLRNQGYNAFVMQFTNRLGHYYVIYAHDPREYYK